MCKAPPFSGCAAGTPCAGPVGGGIFRGAADRLLQCAFGRAQKETCKHDPTYDRTGAGLRPAGSLGRLLWVLAGALVWPSLRDVRLRPVLRRRLRPVLRFGLRTDGGSLLRKALPGLSSWLRRLRPLRTVLRRALWSMLREPVRSMLRRTLRPVLREPVWSMLR